MACWEWGDGTSSPLAASPCTALFPHLREEGGCGLESGEGHIFSEQKLPWVPPLSAHVGPARGLCPLKSIQGPGQGSWGWGTSQSAQLRAPDSWLPSVVAVVFSAMLQSM